MSGWSDPAEEEYIRLYTLAMRICHAESLSKEQAEDVAQDLLLALWVRSLSTQAQPIRDRTMWVAKSARYAAIRALKSRRREMPLSNARDVDQGAGGLGPSDWRVDLAITLGGLPTCDQRLFGLRFLERMTISRIAYQMDISEGTVRRRIRRLKVVLSRALVVT